MKCKICTRKLRFGQNEIDGPGGPIPTDYYIFCGKCNYTIEGPENIIIKIVS